MASKFGPFSFSTVVEHLSEKKRGIVNSDYWIDVCGDDCRGVLFDDGTAVVHAFGCGGPLSEVTPDCQYWSSFYILPPPCANHDQLPKKTVCQVCGRQKGKEWH